jgi:hypothetical protein
MSRRDHHTDEDMWSPSPSVKTQDTEETAPPAPPKDDHAYEDSWYQVLRRNAEDEPDQS